MKILFITDNEPREREEKNFQLHLSSSNNIAVRYTENSDPIIPKNIDQYDAVIFFVKFRNLSSYTKIDWRKYSGLRILYDHDTVQNFESYFINNMQGQWNKEISRHGFDAVIATSGSSVEKFKASGINSYWLPKSYDSNRFYDKGLQRSGYCTFGSMYRSRAKMIRKIRQSNMPLTHFTSKYENLNDELNKYSACLICNMPASVPFGRFGRLLERLSPGLISQPSPGSEVFFKNLESAASGCIQVCDFNPDLHELGFQDGINCITYDNFDELTEKMHLVDEAALKKMQAQSIRTARLHTNKIRAYQLEELCHQIISGKKTPGIKFHNETWLNLS